MGTGRLTGQSPEIGGLELTNSPNCERCLEKDESATHTHRMRV
jgi:hypothetical protein